jgi:hypothetical protein
MKITNSRFFSLGTLLTLCLFLDFSKPLGKFLGFVWLTEGSFQIVASILLTLSESLGILICLKVIIEGKATIGKTVMPLLLFLILYLSVLGTCLFSSLYTPKIYAFAAESVNEVTLPPLVKKLYQGNLQPEQARKTAACIYQLHGIAVPYNKDGSTYSVYEPSPKDIESWKRSEKTHKSAEENLQMLQYIQKECPIQSIIYISSFFSVLLIGAIAFALKRKPTIPNDEEDTY